jgi:flavin reductase (DIM6/NTAB) family NADH-FMN oxidoreductase RutF
MFDHDELRTILGSFATGVTVVTLETTDVVHGMTANAFSSVSLDPPLVLFCADKGTNCHDLVPEAEHFAVNVLAADQEWLSNRFAGEHHDMEDPFEDVPASAGETGAPIIDGTLAYLDCDLHEAVEAGDHTIYIGRVVDAELGATDEAPLTFFRGEYGTIEN